MSVNIDSLDIQITTSAGQSAANIEKLADALEKLRANSKLTSVTNNLGKLKTALDGLQNTSGAVSSLGKLSQAIQGLANLPKLTNLTSAMNALKNIPNVLNGLDANKLDEFKKKMEKLADALSPLATKINTVATGFSKLPSKVSSAAAATNRMAAASHNAKSGFDMSSVGLMALIANYSALITAVNQTIQVMANSLAQAIEWDGIQFRFGRAFGEDAEETYAYIEKINEALGINIQQFMQYSSLYGSLLSGFGMAQDKITSISVGLTELSYDIWAAYNDRFKTLEEASEAVRSAITGEIEPIRNAGIALTEASLQEFIDSTHLAGVSIEKLTEAQKSEVRYAAMVNAAMSQGIVGTYAREMNTAEGAVRSLSQSFKGLVQALGSLFIPFLQVIVPYVTAFIELITEAVFWVAKLFSIPIQEINWGDSSKGVGGLAEGAKDATKGLDGAADAAKKLKQYTMGFDELNVINPNSGAGANGGAGGAADSGWGEGLDLKSLWDDSVFAEASKRVDELKDKVKGFFEEWGFLVGVIGTSLLAWKFSKQFLTGLNILGLMLKTIAGSKGATMALDLFGFEKLSDVMLKLRNLLLKTPIGALILGTGGTSMAAAVAAILAVVAAITAIVAGFVLVYKESENFREGLRAIGEGTIWIFEKLGDLIGWIGEKLSDFGNYLKTKLSGVVPDGLMDFFEKLDIGIGDLLITAGGLALFGPWGLLIEGAVLAIKGIGAAAKDSIAPVDLFGEGISKVTKEKVEPFIKDMDELEVALNRLDWGNAIVSESDLENISGKLKSISNTIVSELDSDKNEALKNLDPLRSAMSDEKFADLQAKVEQAYSEQKETVLEGETRINEIIRKASEDARALTDEEAKEINSIREAMKETGIKYLSESETESNLILTRLKDSATQLSATQASETIKSALSARDETIAAAKEQYDGILLEAQRLLDAGVITKEEYDGMVEVAETAKDDSITAAEEQYKEIQRIAEEKLGEYAKYVDTETGEIKSNWEIFCDDVEKKFRDSWTDIKAWWNTNVAPKLKKEYWKNKFEVIRSAIQEKLDDAKKVIEDKWDAIKNWWNTNVAPKLTKDYWKTKFDGIKTGLKEKLDEAWDAVEEFFSVENWKGAVEDAIKAIKDNFKMPSLPKIKLDVTFDTNVGTIKTAVYKALGLSGWPNLTWTAYASGGFPKMGEAFIAREAGPELVGRIGNKTSVANNDQIVTAVSQGVYSAVVSAMNETQGNSSGSQPVIVYLDGRQIYSSVKRTESRRGVDLMGNQLGYVY